MALGATKPTVTLDIGPLFEDHWTGIPVFTRRLAQSLLRHGGVEVEFAFRLTVIPTARVLAAIRAGAGTLLREGFERNAAESYHPVDASSLPSVCLGQRELWSLAARSEHSARYEHSVHAGES